jgi:hypothetical protein
MQLQDAQANYSSTNVNISTTTETVIITSPLVRTYRNSGVVIVIAYVEVTLGTGTTTITHRIRRGSTTSDPLVNEANALAIQTAVGSSEHYSLCIFEQLNSEQVNVYSYTLQQASATGNGTALEAGIAVLII